MRTEAWRWASRGVGLGVGLGIVAAMVFTITKAANQIVLLVLAILLAAGLEPAIGWVRARTGLQRGVTILIVYAGFFAAATLLLLLVVPSAINQLLALSARLPGLLDSARAWAVTLHPQPLADAVTRTIDTLRAATSGSGSGSSGGAPDLVAAGMTAADWVVSAITILSLMFFWLTGHQRIQRFCLAFLPQDRRGGVREAWNEVETRLGLWVRGQLIIMATIFIATSMAYFVIGVDGALLLGLIAGIAEAVPIVGPALGAVPAIVVSAMSGRVELVLLVLLVYVVIQVVEGNVLVPMIMRSTIGVPPFVVLVSLLVGAAVGGIVGALLAVPLAAALVVILERAQDRDSPVPLEAVSTETTPTRDEREMIETKLPDSPAAVSR